ncbi:MAG: hypothetical protein KJ064_20650 [Anaerolineae bacterium]|nr:MAG: hypothetical protein F9K27_13075 [Anaerolineae bacterium]MCL4879080.1 hypothetical protein [Anaerolineae bacterium]
MRTSVVALLGAVFVVLIVGLFFSASDNVLPTVQQVSSPEASTQDVTGTKGALLALLIVVVTGSIASMGAALYAILWFLNREVNRVQMQEPEPLLLTMSTQGNSLGAALANNAFIIVALLGLVMTVAVIVLLLV